MGDTHKAIPQARTEVEFTVEETIDLEDMCAILNGETGENMKPDVLLSTKNLSRRASGA